MRTLLSWLALLAILLGVTAFALFLSDGSRLGGSAHEGFAVEGRYFVAERGGPPTEVSREDWVRNYALGVATLVLYPLALVGGLFLVFAQLLPRMVHRGDEAGRGAAVARVVHSGPATAAERVSGSVGRCSFGGRGLRVEVRPGGIVVKPLFLSPFAVERRDVGAVVASQRRWSRGLRVDHAGRHGASPIVLRCAPASPLAAALLALAKDR